MKKIIIIASLLIVGILMSCTDDNQPDTIQNTFSLKFDSQDLIYLIEGGEWTQTGEPQEFTFDRSIDNQITITSSSFQIVDLSISNYEYNYDVEVNGNQAIFKSNEMPYYLFDTDIFHFQITLK